MTEKVNKCDNLLDRRNENWTPTRDCISTCSIWRSQRINSYHFEPIKLYKPTEN